jgi:hypothetical protein
MDAVGLEILERELAADRIIQQAHAQDAMKSILGCSTRQAHLQRVLIVALLVGDYDRLRRVKCRCPHTAARE